MRCGASLIVGRFVLVGACLSSGVGAAPLRAQAGQPDIVDAPRVPAAPEVIVRDAAGGATVRAIRLTERTEAWVMFDADNVYVSARC